MEALNKSISRALIGIINTVAAISNNIMTGADFRDTHISSSGLWCGCCFNNTKSRRCITNSILGPIADYLRFAIWSTNCTQSTVFIYPFAMIALHKSVTTTFIRSFNTFSTILDLWRAICGGRADRFTCVYILRPIASNFKCSIGSTYCS
eukprot:NODE_25_length_41203_cov_0.917113.p20 type:complete len:150 gc:universal NODE_25_length_41203_cov_0.917113:5603-6052(+)